MNKLMKHCIMSLSVYQQGDNPVFGETVTKATLDDEAAGMFFTIEQEAGTLRFDFDEFEEVVKAVNTLQQVAKGFEK
jgi:hypothetical protein